MSYFIGQRPCCSSSVSVNVFGWKEMQTRDWVVIWNLASENRALWWHVKPEVLIEFGHIHESMHWQEKKERKSSQTSTHLLLSKAVCYCTACAFEANFLQIKLAQTSGFQWKILKPVPQAFFLCSSKAPPICAPPDRFSSSSASRRTTPKPRLEYKHRQESKGLAGV